METRVARSNSAVRGLPVRNAQSLRPPGERRRAETSQSRPTRAVVIMVRSARERNPGVLRENRPRPVRCFFGEHGSRVEARAATLIRRVHGLASRPSTARAGRRLRAARRRRIVRKHRRRRECDAVGSLTGSGTGPIEMRCQGTQVNSTPCDKLNVETVQKLAALRYQHW